MRQLLPVVALPAFSLLPAPALAAPTFTEIAREFQDDLVWLNSNVRPAIADDGVVVFAGSTDYDVFQGDVLFAGDGGPVSLYEPSGYGLSNLQSVSVNAAGQVALVADRAAVPVQRGVYTTTLSGASFATLYEAPYTPTSWPSEYVTTNVALSANGTVAFATIRSAAGAIYRGPVTGPLTALRVGSGVFFNVRDLDVNDAGQVAVQMEYTDPTAGLSRGILLFDTPGQELTDLDTAIERLNVSTQPFPAINASGQVAFALNTSVELQFFDPPGVYSPTPAAIIRLEPGVYVSTPTPWGEPNEITQYASASGPYATFGRVDINDAGLVVFDATLDDGSFGVFSGPDPVRHKVAARGDVIGSELFAWVGLGELNNAGELSLVTTDYHTADRQVWRVGNVTKPKHHHLRKLFWLRLFTRLIGHFR